MGVDGAAKPITPNHPQVLMGFAALYPSYKLYASPECPA